MKLLFQLGIIFLISILGDFLSALLDIGIPGNVIAMLLMFGLLLSGMLKASHIKETSDFLLKNMVLFFIPPIVNLIGVYDIIRSYVPAILVISVTTTVATFYATYLTVCLITRLQRALGGKRA
jgi:holin-like protein